MKELLFEILKELKIITAHLEQITGKKYTAECRSALWFREGSITMRKE